MAVLVPLDMSDVAHNALGVAATHARALGADMILLTVADPSTMESLSEFAGVEADNPRDILQTRLDSAAVQTGVERVTTELVAGTDPAAAIVDRASRPDVDLVVLGSHGRSGVSRWLLGSVAERVARYAPVPVMIVPAPWRARTSSGAPNEYL